MRGLLIVNLGTPAAPDAGAVGRYLVEFLSDPRVVDLPRWLWIPLLRLVIVPLRRHRSARAYGRVWQPQGSPLLLYSRALTERVDQALPDVMVRLAMRYGQPAVQDELRNMQSAGVTELVVLPLYPQYSRTTTESVFDAVTASLERLHFTPEVTRIEDYYRAPAWAAAIATSIRQFQAQHGQPDRLLFSLHGIPERYRTQGDPYADQCEDSVARIAAVLELAPQQYQLAYQSRVGREPWLQPYTDKVLIEWASQGVRHVQVVCPGFAVDCLETLEEIAMENRHRFIEHGGKNLQYIPALNDRPEHAQLLAGLAGNP